MHPILPALVVGANGYIGRRLTTFLEAAGLEVSAATRETISSVGGCYGDVFYCAGVTGDFRTRPVATVEAHVSSLIAILDRIEFRTFTYLSTTRIYREGPTDEDSTVAVRPGDADDIYNISKLAGESIVHSMGRKTARVVRLSNVVGLDMTQHSFIGELAKESAARNPIILRTTPDSAKDYIAVEDVVELLFTISQQGAQNVYNVANGKNVANYEIASMLSDEFGIEVGYSSDAVSSRLTPINIRRVSEEFQFVPSTPLYAIRRALRNVS